MIETQRKIGIYLPLIFFSIATLLLFEIPIKSAIVLVYVLTVIAGAGQTIATKVGYNGVGVGIGSVVGVGAFTFAVQLLLLLGTPSALAHWSVVLAMTTVLIFGRFGRSNPLIMSEVCHQTNIYMAASVALVVATLRQPWMLPFTCVVVAFGIWLQGKKLTAKSFLISSILATIGWFASSLLRPNRWWYFYADNDFQFFESLSWSIARWGVFEHPGFVGGSIAQYHWLSYGFYGGLSELASLEPWTALLKIGPILSYFVLAELIINASPKAFNPNAPWRWIVLVFVVWLTRVNIADSWAFSILIAVAFLRLAEAEIKVVALPLILLWLLLSGTLIFSKTSTSVVVAAILALKVLWNRPRLRSPQLVPIVSLIFLGVMTAMLMSGSTATTTFYLPAKTTITVVGNFLKSFLEYNMSLTGSRGLLPHLVIWLTALSLFHASPSQKFGTTGKVLLLLTPICVTATLYFDGIYRYFLLTPNLMLSIYIASLLLDVTYFESNKFLQNKKLKSVVVLLFGFLSGFIWRQKSIGLLLAEVFQSTLVVSLAAIVFFLLICVWLDRKIVRTLVPSVGAVLLISVAGVLFSFQVDDFFATKARGIEWYSVRENTEPNFGTNDLIEVGKFIRNRTDQDLILASNNFNQKFKHGGANYLLLVETRRRFLLQGLRFQTGLAEPSIEQLKRLNLSIEFAENPSTLLLKRLKEYGVEGYVVNLALTDRRDWSEFATEAFRSGDFVFLVFN